MAPRKEAPVLPPGPAVSAVHLGWAGWAGWRALLARRRAPSSRNDRAGGRAKRGLLAGGILGARLFVHLPPATALHAPRLPQDAPRQEPR